MGQRFSVVLSTRVTRVNILNRSVIIEWPVSIRKVAHWTLQ